VSDPKALRELQHWGMCIDLLNQRKYKQLLDTAVQRVLSIQFSAADQGKTEKAALRELLPGEGAGLASSGMSLLS
jgi:hypothetical protein